MKISHHKIPKKHYTFKSITEDENTEIISQTPDFVSIHNPDKKFMLLSSEAGYFNRVTQFISGNIDSLLFLNVNGSLEKPTIEEVIKNPKKYFMIYPLPYNMNNETINEKMEFVWESTRFNRTNISKTEVELNFNLGFEIGRKFFDFSENSKYCLTNFDLAINGSKDSKLFWPHKNLIINSNAKFILGILFGYLKESLSTFDASPDISKFKITTQKYPNQTDSLLPVLKERLFIKKNDNSYIFSTMLNWLGASYSFQPIPSLKAENLETTIKLHLSLPYVLLKTYDEILKSEELLKLDEDEIEQLIEFRKLFKTHEWFITTKNKVRKMPVAAKEKSQESNYNNLIETGKIRLLPMTSFKFIEVKENIPMYDFTMPRADATNYALAFTPILKNSDGDILTLSAISGSEAIDDANTFKPVHKEWFRNLNDGSIKNYIADDAILGLFAATKHLS